jgi:hypothetical protein
VCSSDLKTLPAAPTGLTGTAASSSVINLSWKVLSPPANCLIDQYSLFRSTTSGFKPSLGNLVAVLTSETYSDSGLAASTTYYYKIGAIDGDGEGVESAQIAVKTPAAPPCTTAPAAPTGLVAGALTDVSISLSWTKETPPANCVISSYSVYRSTTSGFTPSSSTLIASGLTGTTYTSAGLLPSTVYYYKIESVDSAGTSTASAQASARTLPIKIGCNALYGDE